MTWPNSLKILKFGDGFNQRLPGGPWLPRGLQSLYLGQSFRQECMVVDWPPTLGDVSVEGYEVVPTLPPGCSLEMIGYDSWESEVDSWFS